MELKSVWQSWRVSLECCHGRFLTEAVVDSARWEWRFFCLRIERAQLILAAAHADILLALHFQRIKGAATVELNPNCKLLYLLLPIIFAFHNNL